MDHGLVITLFRHGITEANKRREYLGWTDSPLLQEEQEKWVEANYEVVYCSDLPRCEKTAALLFPKITPISMVELREMNFGDWEGKTYQDLVDEPSYRDFLDRPFEASPPNGESFSVFSARVQRGWNHIVEDINERGIRRAAVITHGGVIRSILSKLAVENKEFWDWDVPHSRGYQFAWESIQSARRGERCTSLQVVVTTAKQNG